MHVINRVFTYIATADNRLDEASPKYYDWRFGKIAYRKRGTGSPVLLVHNFDTCSSMHEWSNIESELAKNECRILYRSARMRMFRTSYPYIYKLPVCAADQ